VDLWSKSGLFQILPDYGAIFGVVLYEVNPICPSAESLDAKCTGSSIEVKYSCPISD
jgi:hypothetical protein